MICTGPAERQLNSRTHSQLNRFAIVDYVVEGPRTAAAISRDESSLLGAVIDCGSAPQFVAADRVQGVVRALGEQPRLYHDAVFAKCVERRYGLHQVTVFDDTLLSLRLLDENLDTGNAVEQAIYGSTKKSTTASSGWPDLVASERDHLIERSMQRVIFLADLADELSTELQSEKLEFVYRDVELAVTGPTAEMVSTGIRVDFDMLQRLLTEYEQRFATARSQLQVIAGRGLNPDSYPELCKYLYDDLCLPILDRTAKGNPALSVDVLNQLSTLHPAAAELRDYLEVKPVVHSLRAMDRFASDQGQRLYPTLDQLGAVTGRYTCCEPNLQAMPPGVLSVFQADEGHVLLDADLSQTELRVLAQVTQDPGLLDAFCTADADVHRLTAARVLGISESEVTPEQRRMVGKPVNFGIIYGQTETSLAVEMGTSPAKAKAFIDAYFQVYSRVHDWIERVKDEAFTRGYVTTLYGRRRRLPHMAVMGPAERRHAERQAVNAVIQGTAADIMKLALARLHAVLPSECPMLLTVHDSVLVQLPIGMVSEIQSLVRREMERLPPNFTLPLKVDLKTGRTWADCKQAACRQEDF